MVDHYNIIYNLKNSCDDNCVDSKNFVFSYLLSSNNNGETGDADYDNGGNG